MDNKVVIYCVKAEDFVLKDKPMPEKLKTKAEIHSGVAKNGHAGANLVVCAEKDVKFYDVKTSDLVSDGGDLLKKENFKVFNVKYSLVKTNVERFYGFGEGYYPNAILPFHAAKKFGENKIAKGENQSVYFSFYIPKGTAAGNYKGTFAIEIDGESFGIPVEINVFDIAVSEENHLKTLFLTDWDWQGPSKDGDVKKYFAYNDLLTEYRLSPYNIIPYPDEDKLEELYSYHAELAYEYCKNPVNAVLGLPYRNYVREKKAEAVGEDGILKPAGTGQGAKELGLECDVFENFLVALIKKSLEKKFNILKKAVTHFGRFIDEPNGQGTMDRLITTYKQYHGILDRLSDDLAVNAVKYAEKYGAEKDLVYEISVSVKNIPHIITAHYDAEYDEYIDTYCPCFWIYQKESSFATYERGKEKWWYGCNGPLSPCPSYHLDDNLLSPRILSWLQYEYGYVGNLFWAVNCYDWGGGLPYFEHYSEIKQQGNVNGDGWLAFPGEIYGLTRPVPTLRMEAIRSGMEDYEVLYGLGKRYEALSVLSGEKFSLTDTVAFYLGCFTRGIKIIADGDVFAATRNTFMTLADLNLTADLCVYGLSLCDGKISGKILIGENYKISCGATRERTERGFAFYSFSAPQGSAAIKVGINGTEKTLDLSLPLYTEIIKAEAFAENFTSVNTESTARADGNGGILFTLSAEKDTVQTFKFKGPECDEKTFALVFDIYNDKPQDKFEGFGLKIKFRNEAEPRDMLSDLTYLPPKNGYMPVFLGGNDWKKSGKIEYIIVSFGENSDEYRQLGKEIPVKKYITLKGIEIIERQ